MNQVQPQPICEYCGKRIARNRQAFVKRGFYASGANFVGHKSCFLEMSHPEDSRTGHERHDIK